MSDGPRGFPFALLAVGATVSSALVTLAWLDRRHVCRAYERDAGLATGRSLLREIGPVVLGAAALLVVEVGASYGGYATPFGAPNPPARGMVAFAHADEASA